jgi:hypothetical protein
MALRKQCNQQGGTNSAFARTDPGATRRPLICYDCMWQDLWDAGNTRDLIMLAQASKLDVGKILEELVGGDLGTSAAVGSPTSPGAAAGSPVSPTASISPPKASSILAASEHALTYNLGGSRVYQEHALEEERRKAEAKAREEAARKAAARQSAIDAQGGIDAAREAVMARRKAEE